jgi:3-oxoisoapionate kinase
MAKPLISYYGDDFTGSTDALEFLTRAGVRTTLFIEPPTPAMLARYPDLQGIGVAGLTRSMTPDAMEATLRSALTALRALGAPHVHYKVCSTFDSSPTIGSIGRVMDVAAEIFKARFIPLLVGAPALGRFCVFGNLFARMGIGSDGEIYRLDRHPSMSKHPITPTDESDLRLHLAKQTKKRTALFDILKVALPPAEAKAALGKILGDKPDVVLFDALYANQLALIGGLIDAFASAEQPLFSVGSSGIEMALGAHWAAEKKLQPVSKWPNPGPVKPLLVASGSCSPVTDGQIAEALANGFAEVYLNTAAIAEGKDADAAIKLAADNAAKQLQSGCSVIIHTSKGNNDPRIAATAEAFAQRGFDKMAVRTMSAELFGSALGKAVRQTLSQCKVRRLCIAGGDTSSFAARALGIEAVEMIGPMSPGAPLCRAHAPDSPADGIEVNFKGGQVGGPDYFSVVASGKPV